MGHRSRQAISMDGRVVERTTSNRVVELKQCMRLRVCAQDFPNGIGCWSQQIHFFNKKKKKLMICQSEEREVKWRFSTWCASQLEKSQSTDSQSAASQSDDTCTSVFQLNSNQQRFLYPSKSGRKLKQKKLNQTKLSLRYTKVYSAKERADKMKPARRARLDLFCPFHRVRCVLGEVGAEIFDVGHGITAQWRRAQNAPHFSPTF